MPLRSFRINARPSGEIFHDFAKAGSVSCEARLILIRSAMTRPITSRDTASVAVTGLRVLGSDRCPTIREPPYRPVVATRSTSSLAFGESGTGAPPAKQSPASRHTTRVRRASTFIMTPPPQNLYFGLNVILPGDDGVS